MPRTIAPLPATQIVRHNERLQVAISHMDGTPVFSHLKAYGLHHQVDTTGAVVKTGEDLVAICDVSDPDLRQDVRAALLVLAAWADELEAGKETPEQLARQAAERAAAEAAERAAAEAAERAAAEAKRDADAKAAIAKATAEA